MAWTVCDVTTSVLPSARSWKICCSECYENWHMSTSSLVNTLTHFGGQSLTYQIAGIPYYDILIAFYWCNWMHVMHCNAFVLNLISNCIGC